jgi:hypothetical protein
MNPRRALAGSANLPEMPTALTRSTFSAPLLAVGKPRSEERLAFSDASRRRAPSASCGVTHGLTVQLTGRALVHGDGSARKLVNGG